MRGLIDLHCDTLSRMLPDGAKKDLMQNDYGISIPGMEKAGTIAQFFACFTYLPFAEGGWEECYGQALAMAEILRGECEKYGDRLAQGFSWEDIQRNEREGKISAILTVEEGGIVDGRMERLEEIFRQGARLITPIWNFENCFGFPNSREAQMMEKGLKPFGKEAVEHAGKLGMIVDVSHASDGGFADILDCATGPVIASHSNCRALCGHPRNLSDAMMRRLAEAGGVAGLNFYGVFLEGGKESRIDAMTAHLLHMLKVGGSAFPAIGTDFDGFDGMEREDIPKAEHMGRLWDALKKAGVSEGQIEGIFWKNAAEVLKRLSPS